MANHPQPSQNDIAEYVEFANTMADNAREIALQYYRKAKQQWMKPDDTWVTEADCKIEEMARSMVSQRYPNHGFFGEEYGDSESPTSLKWCLDPIDGTMPFVYGLPTFGVLISLTQNAKPIVGIIEAPAVKERWCGAKYEQSTWQGQPCKTNSNQSLTTAVVLATSPDMFTEAEREIFDRISLNAKERRFGADCYAYGLLASGWVDVVMESDMKPYDMMALVPVIEGAGGAITDWDGNRLTLNSGPWVLAASNQTLHQECLQLIRSGCPDWRST